MANAITVAQMQMLARFTEMLPHNEELKLAFRYSSGNVLLYFREVTITIYPTGNWKSHSTRTGETISKGEYSGIANKGSHFNKTRAKV